MHNFCLILAFFSIFLASCSSQSKSEFSSTIESHNGYEPSEAELSILFKGYDLAQARSTEKICIDSNPEMYKSEAVYFAVQASLVHSIEDIESKLELNQPESSPDYLPNAYTIDAMRNEKLQFIRGLELKSNHVYFLTSAYAETIRVQSVAENLSSAALALMRGPEFRTQCGTFFASGLTYGGLLTVIYDFEVPDNMDPISFGLSVESQYKEDKFETLLASSKVNTKTLDSSRGQINTQDNPETVFKKSKDFLSSLSVAALITQISLTNYEVLPNFPR